jgi:hypothetical protein
MSKDHTDQTGESKAIQADDSATKANQEASAGKVELVSRQRQATAEHESGKSAPGVATRNFGKSNALLAALKEAQESKSKPSVLASKTADSQLTESHKTLQRSKGESSLPGEVIKRAVEPAMHIVSSTDNLTKIAREHLGAGATNEEIQKHVKEIAKLNQIDNPNIIRDGRALILPGHTADGGYITASFDGNQLITYPDGRIRQENADGTGSETSSRPDGSSTIKRWGPRPEDRHELTREADGTLKTVDSHGTTIIRPNGDLRRESVDGDSFERTKQPGGGYKEHHWGPSPASNYDVAVEADGRYIQVDAQGNKVTVSPNGDRKVENKDGSGCEQTRLPDGGYHEKHWGPKPNQNYEATSRAGTFEYVDANHNKRVEKPNGDVRQENSDGTGYERVTAADGQVSEKHWGPKAHQNYELKPNGHGALSGRDGLGSLHTQLSPGNESISYPDGRMCILRSEADGTSRQSYGGWRPQDRFQITRTPDGKVSITDQAADRPYQSLADAQVRTERERLARLAEAKITNPADLAKFQADMARFEERSKEMTENFKKEGLSEVDAKKKAAEEVAKTYGHISRLLEAGDHASVPLDGGKRVQIAEQIMNNAARPTTIDQGYHNTCNVTSVEMRLYSKNPSEAARLVSDVATSGEYVSTAGTRVKLVAGDLAPHDEAKTNPPPDGGRGLAGQLFEVTAVNIHYQKVSPHLAYRQRERDPSKVPPDTGESLVDYSKKPPEETGKAPGLSTNSIVDIGNEITGRNETGWLLESGAFEYAGSKTGAVRSPQDLNDKLASAKAHGQLPLVVMVHTAHEPFNTDSGGGSAGGSGGWHVVNITDYQPGPPAKVAIDNQWGSRVDHSGDRMVSVRDIYHSLSDPAYSNYPSERKRELEEDRRNGRIDDYGELEYLRVLRMIGKHTEETNQALVASGQKDQTKAVELTEPDYQKQLVAKLQEIEAKWKEAKAAGRFDPVQASRTAEKIDQLTANLPAQAKVAVLQSIAELELSSGRFDFTLANSFSAIRKQQQADVKNGVFDESKRLEYEQAIANFQAIMDKLSPARREAVRQMVRHALRPVP